MPRGVYERKPRQQKEPTVSEPAADAQIDPASQADDTTTATETDATPDPEPVEGEICGECWPAGWPGDGDAAHCSHGEWARWPA